MVRVFTTLDAAELAAKEWGPGWSTMPFSKFEGMINKAPFTPSIYRLTVPVSAPTVVGATQTPKTTKPPFPDVKIKARVGSAVVGEIKVFMSATINGDSFTNHTAEFETVAMAEYSAKWIERWANSFINKIKKDMGY
jgi:hypothetical protein